MALWICHWSNLWKLSCKILQSFNSANESTSVIQCRLVPAKQSTALTSHCCLHNIILHYLISHAGKFHCEQKYSISLWNTLIFSSLLRLLEQLHPTFLLLLVLHGMRQQIYDLVSLSSKNKYFAWDLRFSHMWLWRLLVLWGMTLHTFVKRQCLGGTYCLHQAAEGSRFLWNIIIKHHICKQLQTIYALSLLGYYYNLKAKPYPCDKY
jgi:hypothetical protein